MQRVPKRSDEDEVMMGTVLIVLSQLCVPAARGASRIANEREIARYFTWRRR
jgi:hypothetical protein